MFWYRVKIKIKLEIVIVNSRDQSELKKILRDLEFEIVAVVNRGRIHEELIAEKVIPAKSCRCISPWNRNINVSVAIAENIPPEISAQEQTVLVRKTIIDFCVEVVEIIS